MIELFTASTPNGYKVSIMLEECGIPYTVTGIELSSKIQKEDWFLAMNPNGRIPVVVDHGNDDFIVFESGAILLYLAEKSGQFVPLNQRDRSVAIQWLMFQMGGLGPMQGQAHVFHRYAPKKIPYAVDRYQSETRRLYETLDRQLSTREFLAGELSIADFACWPWVRRHEWAGVDIQDLEHLRRWFENINERPAVQRGLDVPIPQSELSVRTSAQRVEQIRQII